MEGEELTRRSQGRPGAPGLPRPDPDAEWPRVGYALPGGRRASSPALRKMVG
jgi:hypothetical protein